MPYVFQTQRKDDRTPHPRWRFQYTDWRGQKKTATGTTSKTETEKLALRVQADQDAMRKGWKPVPKPSDRARRFDDVMGEYLAWGESQGGRRGHPWGKVHSRMRRSYLGWWKDQLGLEMLIDLVGVLGRVERVLRMLEAQGRSGKTLQNYAESLAALCDWCVTRGYLEADPLGKLSQFNTTPLTRRRAMTSEEITRLLDCCAPHRRLTYEVAFASGLRAGELRALRARHLDVDGGGVRLEAAWTKNRKASFQPLPAWLVQRLGATVEGKAADGRLLYVPSHPARDFDEDLRRASIAKTSPEGKLDFHACRVAYVSWVVEAGATLKEAQALARHASPEMTMNTYARTRSERLVEVTEIVGRNLRAGTTGAQRPEAMRASDCGVECCGDWRAGSIPAASTSSARTGACSRVSRRRSSWTAAGTG